MKDVINLSINRIEIGERIFLNILKTDKFKTNYFSVDFLIPLRKETAASAALLPQVLRRGTSAYPKQEDLNKALDYLYASSLTPTVGKLGEIQSFGFGSYPLANEYALDDTDILGGVLDLLRQVILDPYTENGLLCPAYVESEKHTLADEIRAKINNKNSYAVARCREEMCKGEAYAIPSSGTVEDVEAITPESLTEFYHSVLKTADIEIYYIGKGDPEAIFRSIFSGLERNTGEMLDTVLFSRSGEVREITEDQPVAQGKLSLGFRTDFSLKNNDYVVFALLRELYGGSLTSKLFVNVREKLSLCYYCSAIPEPFKGIMIVTSGIEVANKQKAQDEILLQLDACKNGDITDEEIESAKMSLINAYNKNGDDAGAVKAWYFNRRLAGRSDSPADAAKAVAKVTKEQLVEAAKRITLDTVYFMRGTLDSAEQGDEEDE